MNIKPIAGLCLLALAACSEKNPNAPGFVVASFDGGKITRSELTAKTGSVAKQFGSKLEDLDPMQASMLQWQVLNKLINDKVILNKTGSALNKEVKTQVDQQLDVFKKQCASDEEFKSRLSQSGMTLDDLRSEITPQVALKYLVEKQFTDIKAPTEADAKKFYDSNGRLWNQEEKMRMRYIYLALPANTSDAVRKEKKASAEAIRKRVTGGEDFAKVAGAVSDEKSSSARGGELPELSPGQLPPEFQKAVLPLKAGGISPVFESSDGYHIVQVVQRLPARVVPFEEVKGRILNSLKGESLKDNAAKLIDQLRTASKIQINIPNPMEAMTKKAVVPPPAGAAAPAKK